MNARLLITDHEQLIAAVPIQECCHIGNFDRFVVTASALLHAKQTPSTYLADHQSLAKTKLAFAIEEARNENPKKHTPVPRVKRDR